MHSKSHKTPHPHKKLHRKNQQESHRQISSSLQSAHRTTPTRPTSLPTVDQLLHISPSHPDSVSSSNETFSSSNKSMITSRRRTSLSQHTPQSARLYPQSTSSTQTTPSTTGSLPSKHTTFEIDSIESDSSGSYIHSDSPFSIQSFRSLHAEINNAAAGRSFSKQPNNNNNNNNNNVNRFDTTSTTHNPPSNNHPSMKSSLISKSTHQFKSSNAGLPITVQFDEADKLLTDNAHVRAELMNHLHTIDPTSDPQHPLHSIIQTRPSPSRRLRNLHVRPKRKKILHQLSSYSRNSTSQEDEQLARHLPAASGSLNDESVDPHHLKRSKAHGEPSEGSEDFEQLGPNDNNYADVLPSTNQDSSEDLLPDPSQLSTHTPSYTKSPNQTPNDATNPPRAKYHPRLDAQLNQTDEATNENIASGDGKPSKMFKRRKKGSQQAQSSSTHSPPSSDPSEDLQPHQHPSQHGNQHLLEQKTPQLPPGACTMEEAMECVVKIFVTQSLPNFLQPWQKRPSTDHMGSGFLVKGKRIITNAHVVSDALVVMVRRPGSSRKYIARVVASAHECDLAVLEVEDADFWNFGGQSVIDFENGQITHDHNGDAPRENDTNDMSSYDENSEDIETQNLDHEETDFSALSSTTPHHSTHPLHVPKHVKDLAKVAGENETKAIQRYTNSSLSSPDLPGVGPGSVGAPWWTLLAPDISNKREHSNKPSQKKKFLEANESQLDNPIVPVFSTHDEFVKEPGCLYITPAMPLLQSSVVVVGYPLGGDNCCITQGVVSRIEPTTYAHSGTYLLAIQIDAAINPGNSGGPALSTDGRVIGVAFQNITNASNVGYIIPAPVIIHFLRDVQSGAYRIHKTAGSAQHARLTSKAGSDNAIENSHLFQKDRFSGDIVKVQRPDTIVGTDQRFFSPYLTGFPSIGLFCQETTSESLRDYIGLSRCVKLTPLNDDHHRISSSTAHSTPNLAQHRQYGGIRVTDAVRELKYHQSMLNMQSVDTPGQSLLRRQMLSRSIHNPNSQQQQTSEDDTEGFTAYNFETTIVPAAYSHYHVLEEHIREDVRKKRQIPTIDHGLDQVGKSIENPTLNMAAIEFSQQSGIGSEKDNQLVPSAVSQLPILYKKEAISGVLISEISSLSAFHKLVFPGDVLLAVDGHELGADGSVHFRGHERIAFDHITSLKHNKQMIQLTILRKKKIPNRQNLITSQPSSNSDQSYHSVFGNNDRNGHITIHSMDTDQIHFQRKKDEFISSHNPSKIAMLFDDPASTIVLDQNLSDDENYHVHYDDGIQYKEKHKLDSAIKTSKNVHKSTHLPEHMPSVNDDGIPMCIPVPQHKTIKLKVQNKKQYKHRVVAPCDDCSNDLQLPPYNASYYQNISEPPGPQQSSDNQTTANSPTTLSPAIPQSLQDQYQHWLTARKASNLDEPNDEQMINTALKKRARKMLSKVWSTSLGVLPDYIYTKQNNPVVRQQLQQLKQQQQQQQALKKQSHKQDQNTAQITSPLSTSPFDDLLDVLPNSITSPSIHFTRLPFTTSTHPSSQSSAPHSSSQSPHHPSHQPSPQLQSPNATLKPTKVNKKKQESMRDHILCVSDDYELLTVTAPVSILPSSSPNVYDRGSSYVFFGGLLFVPLSYQYTTAVGNDAPIHLTLARCAPLSTHDEEKVVLAQVLQDNDTVGYPYLDRPITHICGIPIHNLKGLLEVIQTKTVVAATSNLIKNQLLHNPTDLPLLLYLLENHGRTPSTSRDSTTNQNSNASPSTQQSSPPSASIPPHLMIDTPGGHRIVYNVTKDSEERCKQIYNMLCSLSDLLCSETDVQSYTTSLLNIYAQLPQNSLYKQYLQQVVHMYMNNGGGGAAVSPDMMGGANSLHQFNTLPHSTPINTASFDNTLTTNGAKASKSTDGDDSSAANGEEVRRVFIASHIHKQHSSPTTQAMLALFDQDIRTISHSSLPLTYYTAQPPTSNSTNQSHNGLNNPIELLGFKNHTITVQTSENKLITLDMHRAVQAHFRLKDTLNI